MNQENRNETGGEKVAATTALFLALADKAGDGSFVLALDRLVAAVDRDDQARGVAPRGGELNRETLRAREEYNRLDADVRKAYQDGDLVGRERLTLARSRAAQAIRLSSALELVQAPGRLGLSAWDVLGLIVSADGKGVNDV
jgi:hypothetical protein